MLSFATAGSGPKPLTLPSLEGHVFSGVLHVSLHEGGTCKMMEYTHVLVLIVLTQIRHYTQWKRGPSNIVTHLIQPWNNYKNTE